MSKLLIIGIDSMDPTIFYKLKAQMPNFSKLNFSSLQTTTPPETPVAWSAAATGQNPGEYGIFDFISRDPTTYLPKLNLTEEKQGIINTKYKCSMKGKPFWRLLTENNIPVTVLRWPVTFPPEKINGRMLSGLGVVDIKGMLNSYSYYTEEELFGEGKEKVIQVIREHNEITTYISGPMIFKGGELTDVRLPLKIMINENYIELVLSEEKYKVELNNWSELIRVKFKVSMFKNIYGIFNVYLESLNQFKMYMSTVQIDPVYQAVPISYPESYGKELVETVGLFQTLGMAEDTKAVTEKKLTKKVFLDQVKKIEGEKEKIFWYEFEKFKAGVFAFVFDAGDRLTHIFWNNDGELSEEVKEYYLEKDLFLGKVLEQIDEETKLIILSDHGFNNFKRQININNWLIEQGFMKVNSKEGSLLRFVDWQNTKAYSLGFTSVYLNLKEREGQGIVENKEETINEIISKLKELKDGDKRVLTNVYKGSEIYKGKNTHLAPDLVLGFEPGYRMSNKSVIGELDKYALSDNNSPWQGDHLIDKTHVPGVLFTNFRITKENPSLLDLAPTVAKIMGIKKNYVCGGLL